MATGSIRKRKTKKGVSYQITVERAPDPVTGKRDRVYETVRGTKKEAESRMREMITELEGGSLSKQSTIRLGDWVTQFLHDYKPNIADTTRAGYEEKIRNYIIPQIGNIPLNTLNANRIQQWVNGLIEDGKASQTIRNAYNIIHPALTKAVQIGMIPRNPCEGVELPKREVREQKVYDSNNIRNALDAARGTDMYLFVLLFFTLGLRRGEMDALKWDNIDLENNIVHVTENRVVAKKDLITKAPKSHAGKRSISISGETVTALKEAREQYEADKLRFGKAFHDEGYVIRQENGLPFRPDSLAQKWRRFIAKNDLPAIRLHDMRHSSATALIEAGVSPKVVQERLGHSDVATTLSIYTHVTKAMDRQAAEKIDQMFASAGK